MRHNYPGTKNPADVYTSDCVNGCGCWMGPVRSGGPDGVDPFGDCPGKASAMNEDPSATEPPPEPKKILTWDGIDLGYLTPTQRARLQWLMRVPDDEPIFTLRGQDKAASDTVRFWAGRAAKLGCGHDKVEDARRIAGEMEQHPNRKPPD